VSFAAITLCVASQRVFVVVYFVIDSVRKLLDTPSYIPEECKIQIICGVGKSHIKPAKFVMTLFAFYHYCHVRDIRIHN
jgi:hypothetical protein